jgi:hypothetical protein
MKLFVAALVVAIAAASPALAQTKSKQSRTKSDQHSRQLSGHGVAHSKPNRRARSSNPQWDVYWNNGEYSGSDPDPHIRMMLRFDDPNSGDS